MFFSKLKLVKNISKIDISKTYRYNYIKQLFYKEHVSVIRWKLHRSFFVLIYTVTNIIYITLKKILTATDYKIYELFRGSL